MTSFAVGDVVEVKWRPERPVKVDDRMYEAVVRLRSPLIVAAQRRSTLTYAETAAAIDELYPARGLGRALDLLSTTAANEGSPPWLRLSSGRTPAEPARGGQETRRTSASAATGTGRRRSDNRADRCQQANQ